VPEIVIRSLDPTSDSDMDAFQDVYAAAELAEDPDAGLYSREDGVAMMTSGDTSRLFDAFGAFADGHMVAESVLMASNRDNLHQAWLLLWVDPAQRRRGYGARLLSHMEDHARAGGRSLLVAPARIGEGLQRNRAFAESQGFTIGLTEIERRRTLPVDPALLDRLTAEASPHHEDYEILAFVGRVPADLRASYIELRNLLAFEAPHTDEDVEVGRTTVEDLDALDAEREASGRTAVIALAVRDGMAVAHADASVPGGDARHVDQYGTLVHPDHRGHRLGMAVKCAQLRLLSERFGDRDYIQTSNAEINAHMVAINVALGFEIHQVWAEFEKRIARPEASRAG
jgi:GNAT superfamily N-acetyltransferase